MSKMKELIGADFSDKRFIAFMTIIVLAISSTFMGVEEWRVLVGASEPVLDVGLMDERVQLYMEQTVNSTVSRSIKTYTYVVGQVSGYVFAVDGWNGLLLNYSTDADAVFEYMDDNGGAIFSIFVLNGTYAFDAWSAVSQITITGMGKYVTLFNLTDANDSWDTNGDMFIEKVQFISVVDGNSHWVIDASVEFEDCYFNFDAHTNAEAGLFKFRGGSDDYAEFRHCRYNIGDGGGTVNVFFWWTTDMDHLYIDDAVIEMVNATSYAWLYSTGASTWVETIRLTNMEVKDWYAASTGTDSAILWRNGYAVGTLIIDGYKFRVPTTDFGGNNQQLNVNGPMAKNTIITNVVMDYRSHFYAGTNETTFTNSIVKGGSTAATRSAFDFGAQGVYGKTGTASNIVLMNASMTINSGFRMFHASGITMLGSRIFISNEDDSIDGPKHVFLDGLIIEHDDSDGTDLYNDPIQIGQGNTQQLETLSIKNVYAEGVANLLECSSAPTLPLNVTFDNIHLNYTSTTSPELINGASRDGNVSVTLVNSIIESVVPPLDDWNPILKGDRFTNVLWIDTTDGSVYRSEFIRNVTIANGANNTVTTHSLPVRGPESFLMVTPTSDLSTTCEAWWTTYATFTDTQYTIYVGKAGVWVNTDDDVTFWVVERLSP